MANNRGRRILCRERWSCSRTDKDLGQQHAGFRGKSSRNTNGKAPVILRVTPQDQERDVGTTSAYTRTNNMDQHKELGSHERERLWQEHKDLIQSYELEQQWQIRDYYQRLRDLPEDN